MNKLIFDNLEPADKLRKLNEFLKEKDELDDNNIENLFSVLNIKK